MPRVKKKKRRKRKNLGAALHDVTELEKKKAEPWRDLQPFTGVEDLPYADVDTKGKVLTTQRRYYLSGMQLIEAYRGRLGAVRRICRYRFKDRPRDKQILKALKKRGIPGA